MKKILLGLLSLVVGFNLYAQNGAIHFDGSNDVVQTNYDGVLGISNRTFEAWVYVSSSAPNSNLAILDYGLNAVGSRNTFMVNSSRGLGYISGGTNANISSAANTVPLNQWVHVAFVLNSGTGYLYVNGAQVGTGSLTTVNTPSGNQDVKIGQRVSGGTIPFEGSIDEVRIWDVARTQTQIQDNMNGELCIVPSNLKLYLKFNEGTPGGTNTGITTATDDSGNNYDGTLSGFSLSGTTSNWVSGNSSLTAGQVQTTLTIDTCDAYTSPSGNSVWNVPGTYQDTLTSSTGCDTLITVNLSFSTAIQASVSVSQCGSYTTPSGLNTWSTSGVYYELTIDPTGCDTLTTYYITILDPIESETTMEVCQGHILPSGEVCSTSGEYTYLVSGIDCDTLVVADITVTDNTYGFYIGNICGTYVTPSGNIITAEGTYVDTIPNSMGCDSIITIDLSEGDLETGVTQTDSLLVSDADSSTYTFQWIDCNSNTILVGETSQAFNAAENGEYAVIVTSGSCIDTSNCYTIQGIGVNEIDVNVKLYPNPVSDVLNLSLGQVYTTIHVEVVNTLGQVVFIEQIKNSSEWQMKLNLPEGIYTLRLATENMRIEKHFIKQ